jgi:hypothetical protein
MSVSYTKEQRAIAKEKNKHLCTVAARGVECQGAYSEIQSELVADCAYHTMCMKDDLPFERLGDVKLPNDVADLLEECKLSIVRHRANGFEDIEQHEWLLFLNTLRHFVLMPKKST